MDLNKLRTLVFEKTGIRIDTGDPVFALVALNEAVLSESIERHVEALREAADVLRAQSAELTAAGERYGSALRQIAGTGDTEQAARIAESIDKAAWDLPREPSSAAPTRAQWLLGACGIAVLSSALTVTATQLLRTNPPAPQPPRVAQASAAPAFTQEQVVLMQNGEKFAKAWPKLDAATQARITQILQEP